jgi:hypothetical protein
MSSRRRKMTPHYNTYILEGINDKIPHLLKLVSNNVGDKYEYIKWANETFDPSPNSQYITWILRMLKNGVIRGEEDSEKVKERLGQFTVLKNKPQFPQDKRDINSYKTYGDLAETIDEFLNIKTKNEIIKISTSQGIRLLNSTNQDENVGYSLYLVTTQEAASKYFRHTEWCVKDPKFFNQYKPPNYFFIRKDGNPHVLIHLKSNQIMNVMDNSIKLNDEIKGLMSSKEVTESILKNDDYFKSYCNYYSRIGDGYASIIKKGLLTKSVKIIENLNKELKHVVVDIPTLKNMDSYEGKISFSIPFNLTPYKKYLKDDKFLKNLKDIIQSNHNYLNYDIDLSNLNKIEVSAIYQNWEDDDEYRGVFYKHMEVYMEIIKQLDHILERGAISTKLEKFLLHNGYTNSPFKEFLDEIGRDKLIFKHFNRHDGHSYFFSSNFEKFNNSSSDPRLFQLKIDDNENNQRKYNELKMDEIPPYLNLFRFIDPLITNGVGVEVFWGGSGINFFFDFKYIKGKTKESYMEKFKKVKNFDDNYDFYIKQIHDLMDEYVFPLYTGKDYLTLPTQDANVKLPTLKMIKENYISRQYSSFQSLYKYLQ